MDKDGQHYLHWETTNTTQNQINFRGGNKCAVVTGVTSSDNKCMLEEAKRHNTIYLSFFIHWWTFQASKFSNTNTKDATKVSS